MNEDYSDREMKSVESINAAKRRLLELETVEKAADQLEETIQEESHFTNRVSVFLIICELIIVLATVGEIYYYSTRDKPPDNTDFLSILITIVIAGFLIWRLDGWRRVKRNESLLKKLNQKIESEKAVAEKIID